MDLVFPPLTSEKEKREKRKEAKRQRGRGKEAKTAFQFFRNFNQI